jgi:glycosyltransferase involved in cell wall biosynthesis
VPKEIVWTRELIGQFWDGLASTPVLDKLSFSRLAANSIIALAQPHMPEKARCLDYGGGDGHLANALITAGYPSACFDPSTSRTTSIEQQLHGRDGFIGAFDRRGENRFDALFCLEVIEHVPEADLSDFLRDLNEHLTDNGIIFLTCPHQEDLEVSLVYCPICDSAFHRWQHLRSLTTPNVRKLLEAAGFETVWQGLVGFGAPDAINRFLSRDKDAPWPENFIDGSGHAIPIVGGSERIVYVGRKIGVAPTIQVGEILQTVTPARDDGPPIATEPSIAEIRKKAKEVAKPANLVLPAASPEEMPGDLRVMVIPDAFSCADNGERANCAGEHDGRGQDAFGDARAIIYPRSFAQYRRAEAGGILPRADEIHVFEQGKWRVVRRMPNSAPAALGDKEPRPMPATVSVVARTAGLAKRVWPDHEKHLRRALHQLSRHRQARRLQRFVDGRERALADLLRKPTDFPYRLAHTVERRVVLAISSLYNGGAERQVIYTAAGLRQRGLDDVHLLVEYLHNNGANAFYLQQAQAASASVTEVPNTENQHQSWALQNSALFSVLHENLSSRVLNVAEYLHRLAPEVVHVSLDWTNVTVGLAAVLAGVPHIFLSGRNLSPFHFGFFNWFLYPAYRALARQPSVHLLNNSDIGALDYSLWLRMPRERVQVLRNGFDPSRFPKVTDGRRRAARSRYRIPLDAKIVAGAFRMSDEKRPSMWIEAAAGILQQEPNAFFLLCGDGPLRYQTKQLAWSLGVGERIQFMGVAEDIELVFAASDLVMLTSLKEGTPNVLIEAQAMGLPVVATAAFGSAEAVEDGVTGRIVWNETAADVAAAALAVLRDEAFRARAVDAGPAFIERRFGLERMIDDTLSVYGAAGLTWPAKFMGSERRS